MLSLYIPSVTKIGSSKDTGGASKSHAVDLLLFSRRLGWIVERLLKLSAHQSQQRSPMFPSMS